MNISVLTNEGSLFGRHLLLALREQGVEADVVVVRQPFSYHLKLFKAVRRRIGLADTILQSGLRVINGIRLRRRLRRERPQILAPYEELARRVSYVRGTNGPETAKALERSQCDLLVLGQSGIVKHSLLAVPRLGTLNGHPGILPYYRGLDCWKWALLNGEPEKVGATVHWVDSGVDTGAIVGGELFPQPFPRTISDMDLALDDFAVALLARTVTAISRGASIDAIPQAREEGRQYYKMPSRLERRVKALLR